HFDGCIIVVGGVGQHRGRVARVLLPGSRGACYGIQGTENDDMSIWDIDPSHSTVGFTVRHLVIAKVHGRFGKFSGVVELEEGDLLRSKINVSIDVDSIDTREPQRDAHLKSPDFFDAAKFPTMTFASRSIERAGEGYRMTGDLSIHGVTRPVTLEVEDGGRVKDPWGNDRAAFSAKGRIDRKDFGLTWNQVLEAGGLTVGDRVDIDLEVEAVRRKS